VTPVGSAWFLSAQKAPAHHEWMPDRSGVLRAGSLVLAVLLGGCSDPASDGSPIPAQPVGSPGSEIVVGSFDFPESVLLAHLYAGALEAAGLPARVLPNMGTREVVMPALMNGLVQVVPEYAGSALAFLSLGQVRPTSDAEQTSASLARSAVERGLIAAHAAPAQNSNAIVVTQKTADRHHLRSVDDLTRVARGLVFGGPPECPQREYCLRGLEATYGLDFEAFVATDAGGPLTRQALSSGQIDVALLFATDPSIAEKGFVVLDDDRGLQPAENVTPVVSRQAVTRYGQRVIAALDAVSTRLSTSTLRSLNARVEDGAADPRSVAVDWLRAQALVPAGEGVP
jgi:osmoprotectant transport system substrate-binding protein